MVRWRVAEAAEAMGGRYDGPDSLVFDGGALDTRKISGGELFFALEGQQTDGHRFLDAAASAGAAAAVVHREVEGAAELPRVLVEDSYRALHDLTRAVRAKVPERLVGITGSAGKTTTKELLAEMLGKRFRTGRTPGNLNNLYGFPMALLSIDDDCEWMVAEMGMSTPGELGGVSRLGRPDAVILTNVLAAHTEFFESLDAVAEAKAEILEGLAEDGLLVANADDERVRRISERHAGRKVFFGIERPADVKVSAIGPRESGVAGSRFRLHLEGRSHDVELALHGRFNVTNFLAAAACAWALGVDAEAIVEVAREARPPRLRAEVHRVGSNVIIDDSYNSNPTAAQMALDSAIELEAERHWAVLGDMLELGSRASWEHESLGAHAARLGFDLVIGVGELSRDIVERAALAGVRTLWVADAGQAAALVRAELRPGDLVLVKGSRGIGLEKVSKVLLEAAAEEGAA